jgi:putative spermidine/putrescine transport system permease protein
MRFGRWLLLMLLPAGLLMMLFVVGLLQLGWQSFHFDGQFGLGNYFAFFARSDYVAVLLKTIEIAMITTIVCLIVGYPAAYYIARAPRHRNLLMILVILPWLVSVVVRTYGWIVILGNRGTLNSFLIWLGLTEGPIRLLFNQTGVMIGLVHVFCPFMIISILTVLMHVDRSLEEASMSLGAGPIETFFRVLAPLSVPGVIACSTIVFLLSTGAIVTPLLLGGPRNGMLSTQIYQDVFQLFNFPKAASMSFTLMLLAMLLVWPLQFLERRMTRNLKGSEASS